MSTPTSVLEATQNVYEQRFNCIVCLSPRLKMVYGMCQHRVCEDCLYNNDIRRPSFDKCPTCLKEDVFPLLRPDIPEDSIENQRCLGVRPCPNEDEGCTVEMWEWEVESHVVVCPNRIQKSGFKKRRPSSPESCSESETKLKSKSVAEVRPTRVLRSKSLSVHASRTRRISRRIRNSTNILT